MLAILFAAGTAIVWGCSDYCGGRASRGGSALGVTVVSQLFSLPVLAVCVAVLPGALYASDFAWGAAAGIVGFLGIVLLYRGLAAGAMAVVAPITAVTSAVVPMVVGLILDNVPSALGLAGAACAVVAIGLVSLGSPGQAAGEPVGAANVVAISGAAAGILSGPVGGTLSGPAPGILSGPAGGILSGSTGTVPDGAGDAVARTAGPTIRVVALALSAGVMFGVFLALLAQVHNDSGVWPLVAVRSASIPLGLLLLLRPGASIRISRPMVTWVAAAGIGDVLANGLFIFAARDGLLSVVGPIAALYPVSTVLLALFVDKERVRAVQVAGLGLAAAALVLTAV